MLIGCGNESFDSFQPIMPVHTWDLAVVGTRPERATREKR